MDTFHKSLMARDKGAKDWANSFTEVEYLGNGKFVASIGRHRVFKDKTDGKWKKHKLTDERLKGKDSILIQSAKCCVEVHPYYAKYFDVNHEEVRLHEERWIVQRLFKAPDTWRDVDAYNPIMNVEEYSELVGDVVKVTVTYDTDYGVLTVEYFQRDGNTLKHNITFKNISDGEETIRIIQHWTGIVGAKCNGKDFPIDINTPFLAFHRADKPKKEFTIAENLWSMVFNPDGSEKNERCLQKPIQVRSHAHGMKVDFIYGKWVLDQNETLTIDPDTATLDDPTEDGNIEYDGEYTKDLETTKLYLGGYGVKGEWKEDYRSYVEWDISSLAGYTLTANPVLKYGGYSNDATDEEINPITEEQPSDVGCTAEELYGYIASGIAYVDPFNIIVAGGQEIDLGSSARIDLQTAMSASQSWFAIGLQSLADEGAITDMRSAIWCSYYIPADPNPTLYIEYSVGEELEQLLTETLSLAEVKSFIPSILKTESSGLSDITIKASSSLRTESFGLLDTISDVWSIARSLQEDLSLTDTGIFSFSRTFGEVLGTADEIENVNSFYRTLELSLSLTDNRVLSFARLFSESVGLADTLTKTLIYHKLIDESLNFTDTKSFMPSKLSSESIALQDVFSRVFDSSRTYTEEIDFGSPFPLDFPIWLGGPQVSFKPSILRPETAGLIDTSSLELSLTKSENLSVSDVYSDIWSSYRTYSENLSLADAKELLLSLSKEESIGLVDTFSRIVSYLRTKEENLALTDNGIFSFVRMFMESLSLADSFTRKFTPTRTYSEALSIADIKTLKDISLKSESVGIEDEYSKFWSSYKMLPEGLDLADVRTFNSLIAKEEALGLSDLMTKIWSSKREFLEPLALTDTGVFSFTRLFDESLGLADAYSRIWTGYRIYPEGMGIIDTKILNSFLTNAESLALTDIHSKVWTSYLTKMESIGLTDSRILSPSRVIAETLTLVEGRNVSFQSIISESLGTVDSFSRAWSIYKTFGETLNLVDVIIRTNVFKRNLEEFLALTDTGIFSFSRLFSEVLNVSDIYSRTWDAFTSYSESLGLVDTPIKKSISQLAEALSLADIITKDYSQVLSESFNLVDVITRVWTIYRLIAESLGVSDFSIPLKIILLLETLSLTDKILGIDSLPVGRGVQEVRVVVER